MKALLQFLLVIIILVVTSAFAALNDQALSLNYFIGVTETKLTFIIMASFILGCLFCISIFMVLFLKTRLELRRLRKQLKINNQELSNLRELPVKDDY